MRYRGENLLNPQGEPPLLMHAEKIRTAYMPNFRLDPREVFILMSFVGAIAYLLGYVVATYG